MITNMNLRFTILLHENEVYGGYLWNYLEKFEYDPTIKFFVIFVLSC
jgi:hypothetical protein